MKEPSIVIGSREQIFHLLAEASEIEHALMCSYLYAAFSLRSESEPTFSPEESSAVTRWDKAIMNVAIEEMGHLLIVANLTAAIGERPHLTRPNFPVGNGYFPAAVQLRLTAFSLETLDHFIYLERPTGVEGVDGAGFESTAKERQQPRAGLMPGSQNYKTVAHLYEALRANLTAFCERAGAENLFIGSPHGQIGPDIVAMAGVEIITDMASAHRAIDLIVEQGEGSAQDRENSHYNRFKEMKREYEALLRAHPSFLPAWPVAADPTLHRPVIEGGTLFVDAEPAAALLDFANAVYCLQLRLMVQAYTKSGEAQQGKKKRMFESAIQLMHVLNDAARLLPRLKASTLNDAVHAGMTFTMLRAVEPFAAGEPERIIIAERLQQLHYAAQQLALAMPGMERIRGRIEELITPFCESGDA